MSKRKNNNIDRRRLRAAENAAFKKGNEVTKDKTLGRATRRNWGDGGVVAGSSNSETIPQTRCLEIQGR